MVKRAEAGGENISISSEVSGSGKKSDFINLMREDGSLAAVLCRGTVPLGGSSSEKKKDCLLINQGYIKDDTGVKPGGGVMGCLITGKKRVP